MGVRSDSGLKSCGRTRARSISCSVASDSAPSTTTSESGVSTSITRGVAVPSRTCRSATAQRSGSPRSPTSSRPSACATSMPAASSASCDMRPCVMPRRSRPSALASSSAVERPCPCMSRSPDRRPLIQGPAPEARVWRSQSSSGTPVARSAVVHRACAPRASRPIEPVIWPPEPTRAASSSIDSTACCSRSRACSGAIGRAKASPSSSRSSETVSAASMRSSEGRSKRRSGRMRPSEAAAWRSAACAGTPMAGPRSASHSARPRSVPPSCGRAAAVSSTKSPLSSERPMRACASCSRHGEASAGSRRMRPCARNDAVVGSVRPSGSPTRASDGPDSVKPVSSPRRPSRSRTRPCARSSVAPASSDSAKPTGAAAPAAIQGSGEPVSSASDSGCWRQRPPERSFTPRSSSENIASACSASGRSSIATRPSRSHSVPICTAGRGRAGASAARSSSQFARPSASRCSRAAMWPMPTCSMRSGSPRRQASRSRQRSRRSRSRACSVQPAGRLSGAGCRAAAAPAGSATARSAACSRSGPISDSRQPGALPDGASGGRQRSSRPNWPDSQPSLQPASQGQPRHSPQASAAAAATSSAAPPAAIRRTSKNRREGAAVGVRTAGSAAIPSFIITSGRRSRCALPSPR